MNKQEFLLELSGYLRKLPPAERNDIIQDYEEYFSFAVAEGKSENEVAQALGSPKQLAKELFADYHIEKMETSKSTGNLFRAVWSVIGLGFINLVLVLGPFLTLIGLMAAGWIVGISFIGSPLLILLNMISGNFMWNDLFIAIALCGLGFFITIGMYHASIAIKNILLRYLKYNVSIVKGGIKHD